MMILLIILLVIVIVAVSFDLIPFLYDMFWRMKIGSSSDESWFESACTVAENWSEKGLPTVPRVAGKRLTIIDRLKGTYKSSTIQAWQKGSLLLSLNEFNSVLGEKYALEHIDSQTGEWKEFVNRVDSAFLAYAILSNENINSDFVKPAMSQTADMLLKKYNEFGSIPYSDNSKHRYVDTIGLVCPFLIKYSLVYDNAQAMQAAIKLIEEYAEYGLHQELKVPVHCFDAETKAPLGLYSWGRGCGWWAIGLAESFKTLNETDSESFLKEKTVILKNILSFADEIVKYQSSNGAYDRNIFAPCGADSSATAMLSFFLAYIGKLSKKEEYLESADKAIRYIYSVTRRNGVVDYSQGDTMGIGFYSGESIVLPATQGFAIKAYTTLKSEEV